MQKTNERGPLWHLLAGVLMAELGMLLIALGAWDALDADTRIVIYVGGSLLFLSGLFAIHIDVIRLPAVRHEPALKSTGTYLGNFQLNGYLFKAYERQANNGRREFRLLSSASLNPAQEAAFIRYMIHEGLIEDLWPRISKQIEEEANWAFLPQ
jgi:hypothetical protein